jgi:lactoylglutathione lyase
MLTPSVSLIVLRAADLDRTLLFYKTFGLEFVHEQHGNDPVHYSCELGDTVIEIYPGKPGSAPDRKAAGATMIGLRVENIDQIVHALESGGTVILSAPQDGPWGRRAVIQDPDGRAVELSTRA